MFFRQILVIFILLGILGYIFGDYILYFQAIFMLKIDYEIPAYEAFEKIILYYPNSKYRKEALQKMEQLAKRNPQIQRILEKRKTQTKEVEAKRSKIIDFR